MTTLGMKSVYPCIEMWLLYYGTLDDTHLPYKEAQNLFLVTICQIWSYTHDWVREYYFCVQKVWKTISVD